MQDSWGMSHPAQCSTSVEEAESRTGGSRLSATSWAGVSPRRSGGKDGDTERPGGAM